MERRQSLSRRSVLLALAFAVCLAPASGESGAAPVTAIELQPHRAVYELSLENARSATGITGVDGRMVFEFSGSACEGYTLNMRMVTQMVDSEGTRNMTDLRSSTWEQGDGKKFRFHSAEFFNDKPGDVTMGRAFRDPGNVEVRLSRPSQAELQISAKALFPTQHSLALIEAARAGKHMLSAELYDGSEKGQKVYDTTAFIGQRLAPGAQQELEKPAAEKGLGKLSAWPVSIGYFDAKGGDLTPAYQIDFLLYENGVSRELKVDYGDFAIEGHLSRLEYLKEDSCE
jgi:hypothetical protein